MYDARQPESSKNHNIWWYVPVWHHNMRWAGCGECVTRVDGLWGSAAGLWMACGGTYGAAVGVTEVATNFLAHSVTRSMP